MSHNSSHAVLSLVSHGMIPLQRLDVSADISQSVDPLDALIIINDINSPFYTSFADKRLPSLPDSNRDPHPFLDVDCDGFVSPLDVLNVVNAINFGTHTEGWKYESNSSNGLDGGFVSSASCGPKLPEGGSYITPISTEFRQPANKNVPTNPLLGWTVGSRGSSLMVAMHKDDLTRSYFA